MTRERLSGLGRELSRAVMLGWLNTDLAALILRDAVQRDCGGGS